MEGARDVTGQAASAPGRRLMRVSQTPSRIHLPTRHRPTIARLAALLAAFSLLVAACSAPSAPTGVVAGSTAGSPAEAQGTLRLGYFPNITHATALVGVESGIFAKALGQESTLEVATFNAGATASRRCWRARSTRRSSGRTRRSTPSPSRRARRSGSSPGRRRAGRTSSSGRRSRRPRTCAGKKLATPQLGNTQDVALRTWLLEQGPRRRSQGGGDVSILPQENAQTLETFTSRRHRRRLGAGAVGDPARPRGRVARSSSTSATLWPDGQYVTTHLIVRTDYLQAHPDVVQALLAGARRGQRARQQRPGRAPSS